MATLEKIRIAYVQPDDIERHSYEEWKAMSFCDVLKERGVEVFNPQHFQSAFNFNELSDLGYIFFYEV